MSIERSSELGRRVQIHAALAGPGRLTIVDRLLSADASPSELQAAVSMPSNLAALHLHVLKAPDWSAGPAPRATDAAHICN
jgi:ArsR family transcriptional regulator, arsenate/arsenite/antimonite-responsive transcriptional repressor / arsenate reductase (thioredoxin)